MSSIALAQQISPPMALFATLHQLLSDAVSTIDQDRDGTRDMLSRAVALLDDQAARTTAQTQGGLAPWQAKLARHHIDANLEETVSVEELAKTLRLSRSAFARAFKASFKVPPQRYIANRRIERAKELMTTTDEALCQVAVTCGFYDQSHFSRTFRQLTGLSPDAWRRANYRGMGEEEALALI